VLLQFNTGHETYVHHRKGRELAQFEQTLGVVENIDKTSTQLKDALENGKTIIVTTLQKSL
jgi:hypothetical protein